MDKKRSAFFDGIKYDDLIFVCSTIVGMARKVKQTETYVINKMDKKGIQLELDTASVNHCGDPAVYYTELINDYELEVGSYDVTESLDEQTKLPDERYMGSIYARLIVDVYEVRNGKILDIMMEVFRSEFPLCVNDYQMAWYFTQSNIIVQEYLKGEFSE